MDDLQARLSSAIQTLLDCELDYSLLTKSLDQISEAMLAITGLDADQQSHVFENETITPAGLAVSPLNAAKCLRDIKRTTYFIRGVDQALSKQLSEQSKVNVLYAGTGPYALLLLPLLAYRMPAAECLTITLLDLHQESTDALHKLIEALGLQAYQIKIQTIDILDFSEKPDGGFQLIISEVMQRALEKEPQVAVFNHLRPMLADDGDFIPQTITVAACLFDTGKETRKYLGEITDAPRLVLGDLLSLNKNIKPEYSFTYSLPDDIQDFNNLMLTTEIQVYQDYRLKNNDSGLTIPKAIAIPLQVNKEISFNYLNGSIPLWEVT